MKIGRIIVAAATAGLAGALLGYPARGRDADSTARAFSIDGRRYLVGEGGTAAAALLRDLQRLAVTDPATPREFPADVFIDGSAPLWEVKGPPDSVTAVPAGMRPRHVLRLEREDGPVEVVVGALDRPAGPLHDALVSAGWLSTGAGPTRRLVHRTKGKETSIVLMEEKEGRFLLLRRVGE